jgi:hypothetical protein
MRETVEPHSFAASRRPAVALVALVVFIGAWIPVSSCKVKTKIHVDVPQAIRQAKTASFEDLLGIIRGYDKIKSLSGNELELIFTSTQKKDVGELWRYRELGGYVALKRPDSIHLVLLIPLMKSTLLDLVSVGDEFSCWTRENRLYKGKNSAKNLVFDDASGAKEYRIPIRGPHIFEAIFPQGVILDTPGIWLNLEEQTDGKANFYVLSVLKEGKSPRIHIIRKFWIERSGLTIARQQVFAEGGQVESDVAYSREVSVEGFSLPLQIRIERPLDGYVLDLTLKKWNVNPDLGDVDFEIKPRPGMQVVYPREK